MRLLFWKLVLRARFIPQQHRFSLANLVATFDREEERRRCLDCGDYQVILGGVVFVCQRCEADVLARYESRIRRAS